MMSGTDKRCRKQADTRQPGDGEMEFSRRHCFSKGTRAATDVKQQTSALRGVSSASHLSLAALTVVWLWVPGTAAAADGLYKIVDASGKITYSDHLPATGG